MRSTMRWTRCWWPKFAGTRCREYYADSGRRSIPPGVYFRMLTIGFVERIGAERGIARRCRDSLSLRTFLGYKLNESTPDHSSLSRIRNRLPLEVHQAVFEWILTVLGREGLVSGKTIGVDATTLEANAAPRGIVRRDTGEGYDEFPTELAKPSGIETPTRRDLAKIDRERPKKGSNKDWAHPHDPDAQIAKMKDGGTHLAHKLERTVDLDTGAVLAATLHGGAVGDTQSVPETLEETDANLGAPADDDEAAEHLDDNPGGEIVATRAIAVTMSRGI